MTSSSVTSSVVPAKEVSRRSVRMARSPSALPRRALISCCRSLSLSGRKSIAFSLPFEITWAIFQTPRLEDSPWGLQFSQTPGQVFEPWGLALFSREFRQHQIYSLVHLAGVGINFHQIIAADQDIACIVLFQNQTKPGERLCQWQLDRQRALGRIHRHASLLPAQAVERVGMPFDNRPHFV